MAFVFWNHYLDICEVGGHHLFFSMFHLFRCPFMYGMKMNERLFVHLYSLYSKFN